MSFQSELRTILERVEGAQAAALIGFDGIVVADARKENVRVPYQEVGVEFSRILREASKASVGNDGGEVTEMVISAEKSRLLFRVLTREYFLLLMLTPEASLGKGRYHARRATPALRSEL